VKEKKIYSEIFMDLDIFIPLAYENVDLGLLSVCMHVCTNMCLAGARTTEWKIFIFGIQEFIHCHAVLCKYLYLLRIRLGKRSP
jgi:hypothetical protein